MAEATDRGSGTVLMTVLITMAALSITVTLMLASATVARHRAGAIADLAALAGASASPGQPACDRAQLVADANAGRLVGCRILSDGSVVVSVELTDRRGLLGTARASARAGQPGPGGAVRTSSGSTEFRRINRGRSSADCRIRRGLYAIGPHDGAARKPSPQSPRGGFQGNYPSVTHLDRNIRSSSGPASCCGPRTRRDGSAGGAHTRLRVVPVADQRTMS